MIKPQFENKGHKYLFTWPDYKLEAQVSRIHKNSDRSTCQLLFTSTHDPANSHILQTRFNLESSRSRAELAREMQDRYQVVEDIEWKNLLEYISIKTLREVEIGEPVLELTSADEIKPLEYLVAPIAPKNKPTVIFGDPGAGKSQLCVLLCMVIALPWNDNPLRLVPPAEAQTALFLDYEADPDDVRRQLKMFAEGMELGLVPIHYRRCTTPLVDDIEAIRNHADSINASCLFVDSISLAAGGDLNKNEQGAEYFRALRQLNMTSISLAHTSKDRETKVKTPLGSVLFEAGARSIWECRGQEDEDTLDIALFHRKANLSKKSVPLGFRVTYGDSGNTVSWHDPRNVAEFVERMSLNQRIVSELKTGKLSTTELAELLEAKRTHINVAISRLVKAKKVTGDSTGWGLNYEVI